MKRWKFTFDKDEEQAWLNDYARCSATKFLRNSDSENEKK